MTNLISDVEEKQIEALKAGATPEDASLRGRLSRVEEVTPEEYFSEEEGGEGYDLLASTESREPIRWNADAASSYAAKMTIANGSENDALMGQIRDELVQTGESPTAEALISDMELESKATTLQVGSELTDAVGAEIATPVVQERLDAPVDPAKELLEQSVGAVIAVSPAFTREEWLEALDTEMAVHEEWERKRGEMLQFSGTTVGNIVEFFGAMVPFNEQASIARLSSAMQEEFGVDLGSPAGALIASGEHLKVLRDWYTDLSSDEQFGVLEWLSDNAADKSGFFGDNDFIRLTFIQALTEGAAGEVVPGDFDLNRAAGNVVSVADLLFLGGVVRGGVRAIKGAGNGVSQVDKTSNLATVERLDPETGSVMAAEAVVDETGQAARSLGTTREDVTVDSLLPKWEGYADGTHISDEWVQDQMVLVDKIRNKEVDLSVHLTEAEKTRQLQDAHRTMESVKDAKLWGNSSKFYRDENGIVVEARYGKNAKSGYQADEVDAAVEVLKKRNPQATVEKVRKSYDGTVVKTASPTPTKSIDDAKKILREELTEAAGGKLPRGATTQGKAVGAERRTIENTLKQKRERLRALRNPKSNVKKNIKQSVEREVATVLKTGGKNMLPKTAWKRVEETLLNDINNAETALTKFKNADLAGKAAKDAEANLSRLEQGQMDKLKGEAKRRWKELTKGIGGERPVVSSRGDEWFVDVKYRDDYRAASNAILNMDDIHASGWKANLFQDVSSGLAQHLSNSLYTGFDMSRATEKALFALMDDFAKAKNNNKKIIVSLLDEGKMKPKTFTPNEVLERLPQGMKQSDAQEVLRGYASVRMFADTAHDVLNKMYYDSLKADNIQHIKHNKFDALAAPVSDGVAREMRVVYDPHLDAMVELTSKEVDKMLEEGATFFRSPQLHNAGTDTVRRTNNIVVRGETTVSEIPRKVLNYIEGYLPRMYKEQYFITKRPKEIFINGLKASPDKIPVSTILVAKNKTEAKKLVAEMAAKDPDAVYDWKNAVELTTTEAKAAELSLELSTGGLFFSKREEHLKDANNLLAETEDSVGSIMRMASVVARKQDLEPIVNLMKRRWLNTFGQLEGLEGRWPMSVSSIGSSTKVSDKDVQKAKAAWLYIDQLESSATVTQKWRASMVRFGEWVEGIPYGERLGSFIRTGPLAERDPLSYMRGATFLATIVFNPMRQLFLQSQQFLFLSGLEPSFIFSGQSSRQAMALGMATVKRNKHGAKADLSGAAKVAGIEKKEFEQMVDALEESGLVEAIDSHLIGRDAMTSIQREITEGALAAGLQKSRNVVSKVAGTVREYGFDFGERANILHTYGIARHRWLKNNPGADVNSKKARFEIAAATRQLSLGMTQPGGFKYQRGIASLATQFLSVQHKAFLAGIRGVPGLSHFGNKAITVEEGRRLLMAQTMLYGASGIGLYHAVDWALDELGISNMSDEAKHMVYGGVYDLTMNAILSGLTGDEVDLSFANSIAAGSGWHETLTRTITDLGGDRTMLELLAGPSRTPFSKLGAATSMLSDLLVARAEGVELTPEQVADTMDSFAVILSGYNNFMKAKAMKNLGAWVDANRAPLPLEASSTEAWVMAMTGVTGYDVDSFYGFTKSVKANKDDLQEVADLHYKRLTRRFATMDFETGHVGVEALSKFMRTEKEVILAALGKQDGEAVLDLLSTMIKQRLDKGEGVLANQISRAVTDNSLGVGVVDILTSMGRKGIVEPEVVETSSKFNELTFGVE